MLYEVFYLLSVRRITKSMSRMKMSIMLQYNCKQSTNYSKTNPKSVPLILLSNPDPNHLTHNSGISIISDNMIINQTFFLRDNVKTHVHKGNYMV